MPVSSIRARSRVMICSTRRRERSLDDPVRCRLDRELDARRVDHQADAAELASGLRAPAQQAEVQAARRPDAQGEGSS